MNQNLLAKCLLFLAYDGLMNLKKLSHRYHHLLLFKIDKLITIFITFPFGYLIFLVFDFLLFFLIFFDDCPAEFSDSQLSFTVC